jgi:hypothetical protein
VQIPDASERRDVVEHILGVPVEHQVAVEQSLAAPVRKYAEARRPAAQSPPSGLTLVEVVPELRVFPQPWPAAAPVLHGIRVE